MNHGWIRPTNNYHHHFAYGRRGFRLFPRLFWFALGAGAFAFWSRHEEKERRIASADGARLHNGEWKQWSGHHFGCHRRREQLPPQEWNAPAPPPSQTAQPVVAASAVAHRPPTSTHVQAQQPAPAYNPDESISHLSETPTERFREVGKQASDAMAEMSENALDSLLANIQALKAKIAEAREAREREKMYLEQRIPTDPSSNDKDHPKRLV